VTILNREHWSASWPLKVASVFVLALAIVFGPSAYGQYLPQRATDYLIYGMVALAVGLIVGHARLLNIGVGATFGISAYAVAVLANHGVLNPFLVLLGALLAGLAVSLLFALFAVVATGLEYFLLTLLTTSAFFGLPLLLTGSTGGENGLGVQGVVANSFGLDPLQGNRFYWLVAAIAIFWMGVSWYLLASRAGRVMTAIGRNPDRAAAMGYSVNGYRVAITLYSGVMAASAGWLYALNHAFVFPDLLGLTNSLNILVYSLIGGVTSVVGPFVGTAGLRFLSEYSGEQSTQSQLYVALALLLVVYLLPNGILGVLASVRALRAALLHRTSEALS